MEYQEGTPELPVLVRDRFRRRFTWLLWACISTPILCALITAWYSQAYSNHHIPIGLTICFILGFFVPLSMLYGHYKRHIFLRCPSCGDTIPTFDSWQCGFCKRETTSTLYFSFLNKCSHRDCRQSPAAYQCQSCGEPVSFTVPEEIHHIARKWEPELTEEQIQERHERFKRDRVRVREQREFQKEDAEHNFWEETVTDTHNIKKTRLKTELTEEEIRLRDAKRKAEEKPPPKPKSKIEILEGDLDAEVGEFFNAKKVGLKKIEEIEESNLSEAEKERLIRKIKNWMLKHGYEMM